MQIDAFANERMKILYALSFIHGGMAQIWAANETSTVLANTSTFNTLEGLLASVGGHLVTRTRKGQPALNCMHLG